MANSLEWVNAIGAEITNGIVGWWKFSEGSGSTTADSSGNGNTGTLSGAAPPTWTGPGGLKFSAGPSYVDMGTPAVLALTTAGTVSAWIYQTASFPFAFIVSYLSDLVPRNGYQFLMATPMFGFQLADAGSAELKPFIPMSNTSFNVWYHVGITWDNTNVIAYLNGNGLAPVAQTVTPTTPSVAFRVGSSESAFNNFIGNIDDVRVYNRALSSQEMQTLYLNGAQ